MIASAIKQIVNTDRAGLKNFFSEVNKLNKTDEAVKASAGVLPRFLLLVFAKLPSP
jgi:hypothetical protein